MKFVSASSLKRHCAYPRVLDKIPPATAAERKREANRDTSADRGTVFHKAVENWAKSSAGQLSHPPGDDEELNGWLDLLASQWAPPRDFESEIKWGLAPDGSYRDVLEPEPHVYVAADGSPLLTAGTCDGVWTARAEDRIIATVDWKSGKWPVEPARTNLQVNAAGMALTIKEFALAYVPGIYYARDGVFDWGDIVQLGSKEWGERLAEVQEAALMDETPRPGPWCKGCWDKKRCPSAEVES